MKQIHLCVLPLVLGVLPLLGCARPPSSVSSSSSQFIEPLEGARRGSTGFLIATVHGTPRDIEYFINGVLIEPQDELKWWKDARLEVELRPGFYSVEAIYSVRAFSGKGERFRVATQEPVEILSGRETHIKAEIRKDWRGVPQQETTYFRMHSGNDEVDPQQGSRAPSEKGGSARTFSSASVPVQIDPLPSAEKLGELLTRGEDLNAPAPHLSESSSIEIAAADNIYVQGGADGGAAVVRIERTGNGNVDAVDDIIIHGDDSQAAKQPYANTQSSASDEVSNGTDLAPLKNIILEDSVGLPADAAPYNITLRAPVEENDGLRISVLIESDPSGASVSMDERPLGQTPLRVRIDPLLDHVLLFERQGCGDFVRLLSSNGWQQGRSPSLLVNLQCQ